MPRKSTAWDDRIEAAEFRFCLGLGLIMATDESMERDLARITRLHPAYFPGKKHTDGTILYDDAQALAFVVSECPDIPRAYIQDWLQVWDATAQVYTQVADGADLDQVTQRLAAQPAVCAALERRGERIVIAADGSVGAG